MPIASRVSLPENFYDLTSPQLLLQPEPGYIFARAALAALRKDLPMPDMIGLPGREPMAAGAGYVSPESQRFDMNNGGQLLADMFAAAIDFDAMPGQTVRLNRPLYPNTTYTTASRQIGTNTAISTTPISVASEQVDLTIFRFAGPYDQANSRVAPYGLDALDSRMGVHKMSSMIGGNMRRDFHKFIDSVFVLYGESSVGSGTAAVYPGTYTTDNGIPAAGAAPMDFDTIARTERNLDEGNIPYFAATGKRALVLTPQQTQELKNDAQFARYAEFHKEINPLFPEYVASVGKFDIFKSNTLRKVNNSSSVPINRGLAFGPGIFGLGMGGAPRIAPSTDDNFGETAKVIWLAYLAFQMFDNRFGVSVRTG